MGGCCCSSSKAHLHGTPGYYYCPPTILEEHESVRSLDGAIEIPTITSGFLINLNLETSSPDSFRPPPAPLPYDVVLRPQYLDPNSCTGRIIYEDPGGTETDYKTQSTALAISPKKLELSRSESEEEIIVSSADEEDVCPVCLEEYDMDNPRLVTKCNHQFHLSCLLEWTERNDTCPICDKALIFDHSFD